MGASSLWECFPFYLGDGHVQPLCDALAQSLIDMLEDLELLVDDPHVGSLTHVPDNVVDQVVLVSLREIVPLHCVVIVSPAS